MFVKDQMTKEVITVTPTTPVPDALKIMQEHSIRRLPVMNKTKLVGIVTENDLLKVSPSPASSLSIFEINFLIAKMTVKEIMAKKPLTVSPDATIEEAALIMREKNVGGLPVVDDKNLVGIISESDIFDALINLFGLERPGRRLTLDVEDVPGVLANVSQIMKELNINIINVANHKRSDGKVEIIIKIDVKNADSCVDILNKRGFKVTQIN